MRDREWWLFDEMIEKDPYCLGMNYPKGRREGATTRVSCKRYLVASSTPFARVGLQSKDDIHAKEVHQVHVLDQFMYHTPFWFIPIWEGDRRNGTSINFYPPDGQKHPDFGKKSLQSIIDFRPSNKTAYDGLKLRCLHVDETGKCKEEDVYDRWGVQKECLVQGSRIIGKAYNTSTVEEMDTGGGKEFKKICDESHFEKRNKETGRTATGLYNFFMPSSEGFGDEMPPHYQKEYGQKNWVDKYGQDLVDKKSGRPLAEKYLLGLQQSFLDSDNIEAWIDQVRKYPLRWKDCWKRKASTNHFNLEIIENRLDYYRNGNPDVVRGNFMWEGGIPDSTVIFCEDRNGRWEVSYLYPDPRQSNRFFMDDGRKQPASTLKFIAGADPFKSKRTKSGKRSMGGISVFMKRDLSIDFDKRDISEWETHRFCCTYLHRGRDVDEYGEDVLLTCVYYGCKVYPEMNAGDVENHFFRRGYAGYLFYRVDKKTGKQEVTPGEHTGTETIDAIFKQSQYHIQHHGMRERHTLWLEQCKEIEDDMGDFDLFTACGMALLGASHDTFTVKEQTHIDIKQIFRTFTYN